MRRAALVLVLGLAVSVPAASSLSQAGWKGLKYFDYGSQHLVVATDAAWQGGRVVPALPTQRLRFVHGPGLRRTTPQWLWSTTCGSSPQFVSFTRQVRAPGDPQEGSAQLHARIRPRPALQVRRAPHQRHGGGANRRPAGRVAAVSRRRSRRPCPARALKAFNYGPNTLTIRARAESLAEGTALQQPEQAGRGQRRPLVEVPAGPHCGAVPARAGQAAYRIPGPRPGGRPSGTRAVRERRAAGSSSPGRPNVDPRVRPPRSRAVQQLPQERGVNTRGHRVRVRGPARQKSLDRQLSRSGQAGRQLRPEEHGQPLAQLADRAATTSTPRTTRRHGPPRSDAHTRAARATAGFTPSSFATLHGQWQIVPDGGDDSAADNSFTHTIVLCGATTKEPRCANAK